MTLRSRQRRRAGRARSSSPPPQKWPETMDELNALPESNKPLASQKPIVSTGTRTEGARHSENTQKAQEMKPIWQESDQQSEEKLLN